MDRAGWLWACRSPAPNSPGYQEDFHEEETNDSGEAVGGFVRMMRPSNRSGEGADKKPVPEAECCVGLVVRARFLYSALAVDERNGSENLSHSHSASYR